MEETRSADSFPPSPVPSDQRLWPYELPFTAFGQFGVDSLDLRVFDQEIYWVNGLGVSHLISRMSIGYLVNVISFLCEFRGDYFDSTVRRWFIQTMGDQLLFDEPGAEVLAVAAGGPSWSDLDPAQWLESTVLMRALRKRVSELTPPAER